MMEPNIITGDGVEPLTWFALGHAIVCLTVTYTSYRIFLWLLMKTFGLGPDD